MRWTKLYLICICFQKKIKLTHRCFKYSPFICISWIDRINFLHFWPNKICVSLTSVISALCPPRCRLSFGRRHHAAALWHTSFPWSQNELVTFASSFDNASSRRLLSWAEIEALNPHHHCRPPSSDHLTLTLYCYKKVISTLTIFPITRPHLHFASSLARAPHNRSSTHRHHSLSPLSHTHHPSS
jgi:hypothetical protein